MQLEIKDFEASIGGRQTGLFELKNGQGTVAWITNFGARIVGLITKDKNAREVDVITGFSSIRDYQTATEPYHGAIIGRFANRIALGRFQLKGKDYQLAVNNPPNHLHGGPKGFHNQVWEVLRSDSTSLHLSYFSPDGEENYPGNLTVYLRYSLSEDNELAIEYEATTDESTIINLTSHPFFNLNGQGVGTVDKHQLQVSAEMYTPVDENLIPTGLTPVVDTAFDFRTLRTIGERIEDEDEQLKFGAGYDHNFVLDGKGFRKVATAVGDASGIHMDVYTDQPGMQLYSGNFMKGENAIKYGLRDLHRGAFCLETQHFPDAPNHPEFPDTVLEPGQVFQTKTVYRFYLND